MAVAVNKDLLRRYAFAGCCVIFEGVAENVKNTEEESSDVEECCESEQNPIGKTYNYDSYDSKSDVAQQSRIYTDGKPFECDICNYKCSLSISLMYHKMKHTGERPYACKSCDYKSTRPYSLKKHMQTHSNEKLYTCGLCDYECNRAYHMKTHIRTHTGKKLYACDICRRNYVTAHTLKIHMRTHTGEKPYACEFCEYKTGYLNALTSHAKRKHTGKKKSRACEVVGLEFKDVGYLKAHMKRHKVPIALRPTGDNYSNAFVLYN